MTGRPHTHTQYSYWVCVKNKGETTAREVSEMLMVSRETALKHLRQCVDAGYLKSEFIGREYIYTVRKEIR